MADCLCPSSTGFDTAASLPTFWMHPSPALLGRDPERVSQLHPNVNNEFRFGWNRYSQFFPVGDQTFPGLGRIPNFAGS